jgi:leucyl-tRNA synthetase
VDQTVLANEQVDVNGNSWRSGAKVEKKRLSQWFFRITAYSKELNEDLAILEKWPERVKQMQAGWIGVKEGHKVSFKITDHNDKTRIGTMLEIFTTRVETIMGCTFVAVPAKNSEGKIMGQCVHPLSGAVLPIYEADYVAEDFGTGAIMGVPAHDENDKKFAEKFNIPLKTILSDDGTTLINSQSFTGLSLANARKLIEEELKVLALGESHSQTHLRDWLVSRQRYWGAPIPIVYCKDCGIQPVP